MNLRLLMRAMWIVGLLAVPSAVSGQSATPDQEEQLERAFREFYGFDFDVIVMESGLHPQKASELEAVARSGVRSGIDLFWSGELILNRLYQAGLLRDAAWLAPLELPADGLLLGGKAARVHDSFLVNVLYNTQRVKADEAPRRYHPRQRAVALQQVVLSDDVLQCLRAQPICQRSRRRLLEQAGGG